MVNIKVDPSAKVSSRNFIFIERLQDLLKKTPARIIGMFYRSLSKEIVLLISINFSELRALEFYIQNVGLHERDCERRFIYSSQRRIWSQRKTSAVSNIFVI